MPDISRDRKLSGEWSGFEANLIFAIMEQQLTAELPRDETFIVTFSAKREAIPKELHHVHL